MFGKLDVYNLPTMNNYKEAEQAWNKLPARKDNIRILVRGQNHKFMTRHANGDLGLALGHELVRYNVDGSLVVVPHSHTQADSDFANRVLPNTMQVEWKHHGGPWLRTWGGDDDRYYRNPQAMELRLRRGRWTPVGVQWVWQWPKLKAGAVSAALKAGSYADWDDWARAYCALGNWRRVNDLEDTRMTTPMAMFGASSAAGREHIAAALARPDRWEELILSPGLTKYAPRGEIAFRHARKTVRLAVLMHYEALKVETHKYISGSKAFRAYQRAVRTYNGAV